MGLSSPSTTGQNGHAKAGFVTPEHGSTRPTTRGGRGGGRGGIPRQGSQQRYYNFSSNFHHPKYTQAPSNDQQWDSPPQAPVLQDKGVRTSEAFFVNEGDLDSTREIKLTVEFPTNTNQDRTNDISLYFKRFATVLLAAHPSIAILNWVNPSQNPVIKAIDISPTEASIKQYFSGVVIQANRNKIRGFVKIQATTSFGVIKRNDRLWGWLTKNKVYVRTTQLAQSRHVNIGWILSSHAEYSNQELACADLRHRMDRPENDFELVPHTINHLTSAGTKVTTKALKLRTEYDSRQVVFRKMLECLKLGRNDSRLTNMSNTGDWKLIPFAQNTISRDQMTELVKKQNRYLHEVTAISFINLGSLEGSFSSVNEEEPEIREEEIQHASKEAPPVNQSEGGRKRKKAEVKTVEKNKDANKKNAGDTAEDAAIIAALETTDTTMGEGITMDTELEKLNRAESSGEDGYTTATMEKEDNTNRNEGNRQKYDAAVEREGILRTGGETLLQMLAISAGDGTSLFTSWEPGRLGQYYFLTTKTLADRASEWLDNTMNKLLNEYGLEKCALVLGAPPGEMPREETKVRPDAFIMDYISSLDIEENIHRERGGKERAPPDMRSPKRRALVVYGEDDSNAWDTPLIDKDKSPTYNPRERVDLTHDSASKVSVDLTGEETATSAPTEAISQLTQDLAFLRKDFNESIKISNDKRNEENTQFLEKIATVQLSTEKSVGELTTFINGTLKAQDGLFKSLKQGQDSLDERMTTVTDTVQKQMNTMNTTLVTLQNTMLRLAGVPESDIANTHCATGANSQLTFQHGTQPVLLGGLGEL